MMMTAAVMMVTVALMMVTVALMLAINLMSALKLVTETFLSPMLMSVKLRLTPMMIWRNC